MTDKPYDEAVRIEILWGQKEVLTPSFNIMVFIERDGQIWKSDMHNLKAGYSWTLRLKAQDKIENG